MELYTIKKFKEDGRIFVDMYLVWTYEKNVRHVRVIPRFFDKSWNVLIARSIKAENVEKMLSHYKENFNE